jgi:hypothetical protein
MYILATWNFRGFIIFFQKGLNLLKLQGRFNFEFVPEFITCNSEGILSCVKKERCYLCFKLSLQNLDNFEYWEGHRFEF